MYSYLCTNGTDIRVNVSVRHSNQKQVNGTLGVRSQQPATVPYWSQVPSQDGSSNLPNLFIYSFIRGCVWWRINGISQEQDLTLLRIESRIIDTTVMRGPLSARYAIRSTDQLKSRGTNLNRPNSFAATSWRFHRKPHQPIHLRIHEFLRRLSGWPPVRLRSK